MQRDIIVHVHIFKNAGSSFDSSLREVFDDDFVDHREDQLLVKGKLPYLKEYLRARPNVKAFSSHSIYFNLENDEEFNFIPVYFLRHPIDRVRSVYSFEKKQVPASTIGSQKAKELDFEDYIKWYLEPSSPATIRNCQTIFLSGQGRGVNDVQNKFEVALKTLESKSVLIGVVDRYDESAILMEGYLKAFFPDIDLSYIRRNTTDKNLRKSLEEKVHSVLSSLSSSISDLLVSLNSFDEILYQEANDLLDKRMQSLLNREQANKSFKERCFIKQANALKKQRKYRELLELSGYVYESGMATILVYLNMAEAYKCLGDIENAISIYERAINMFRGNIWPYLGLSNLYFEENRMDEACCVFNDSKNLLASRKFSEDNFLCSKIKGEGTV